MYTQQAPSLIRVLRDVLQPEQLEQLTNALGNCQQPLAHRGPVALVPPASLGRNNRGVYGPGAWDPAQHPGLIPTAGQPGQYEIGGMQPPTWNSGNQYASGFNFPTTQFFALNNYLGGAQVYITNSKIDNITNQTFQGNTASVASLTVQAINNQHIPGSAGPPGAAGQDGLPGAPGGPGAVGFIPVGRFGPIRYLTGNRPRVDSTLEKTPRYVTDAWVRPVAVTLNPDTCEVSMTHTSAASTLMSKLQGGSSTAQVVSIVRVVRDAPLFIPVNIRLQDVNPRDARVFQQ